MGKIEYFLQGDGKYHSNTPLFIFNEYMRHAVLKKVMPDASPICRCCAVDKRLVFRPSADIEKVASNGTNVSVQGIIVDVTDECIKLFEASLLKRYPDRTFHKCLLNVSVGSGESEFERDAFTYVMEGDMAYRLPSQEYYRLLCEAYADWSIRKDSIWNHFVYIASFLYNTK